MDFTSIHGFVDSVDYNEYTNRQLLVVPLSVLALALVVVTYVFVTTGAPVGLGIDFSGGTEIRVAPEDSVSSPEETLSDAFSVEPSNIRNVPSDNSYVVTFSQSGEYDATQAQDEAQAAGFIVRASSSVSPAIGGEAQRFAVVGFGIAFGAMSILVFGLFRTFVPSIAVVASAFSDIIVPVALMNIFGIDLTLGTVAALLLLVGYSVDSDMLLNDYVVRRRGDVHTAVKSAMKTGLTMTITSLLAMSVLATGALLLGISILQDVGTIIAFGLAVDIMNTYMMNVALLRYFRGEY